jgi:hypothetical protein
MDRWVGRKDVDLGGLVVACLPLDPKFAGSNAAEDDGFLRAIKIRSAASFRGELKPSLGHTLQYFTAC